jgi:probable HAF family extracellular repeat protein
MNTSENLQDAKPGLIFVLVLAMLFLCLHSVAQSITMPSTRDVASMQDHDSHPQQRLTNARHAIDDDSSFTFTSIDVPGAIATIATGINARGHIVGIYSDAAGNSHGFLLRKGDFFTIDVPGALVGVSGTLQTEANGINAKGDIVGDYYAPPGAPGAPACTADTQPFSAQCRRGFLLHKGEFSDVLVPGKKGSIPNAISSDGTIYGCDHNDDYFASMVGFGRIDLDT